MELLGFEAPGPAIREVDFPYRLVEGRIAERWAIRDDLTMLRQLGAASMTESLKQAVSQQPGNRSACGTSGDPDRRS